MNGLTFSTLLAFDWRQLRRGRSFWLLTGLLLAIGGYAALYGRGEVREQHQKIALLRHDIDSSMAVVQARLRKDDTTAAWHYDDFLFALHSNPPDGLAALAFGQRDLHKFAVSITIGSYFYNRYAGGYENKTLSGELANPQQQFAGHLDVSFVLVFLLPLYFILLSYNVLSSEQEGGILGKWVKNEAARAAEEKLKFLTEKDRPLPGLLEPDLLAFARAAKAADRPAPPIGFDARAYYQPEQVGLSLTAYAAQREAERQLVVRVQEPVGESQATGRADALQRSLISKGATVSVSHTVDAQGNRVGELTVQYSVQQPRSEVKEISFMLDWAAKQPGYQVQEREADRAQRQAPGQQDAQREQARTPGKSQGLSYGGR